METALLLSHLLSAVGSLETSAGPSLADYGIAGVVATIFLAGIIVVSRWYINELKAQRDEQRARADRLEMEIRNLNQISEDRIEAIRDSSNAALNTGYSALLAALTAAKRTGR